MQKFFKHLFSQQFYAKVKEWNVYQKSLNQRKFLLLALSPKQANLLRILHLKSKPFSNILFGDIMTKNFSQDRVELYVERRKILNTHKHVLLKITQKNLERNLSTSCYLFSAFSQIKDCLSIKNCKKCLGDLVGFVQNRVALKTD